MVRPFRSETERYGEYSKAGEFVYDHPFLWGSKRTGPDLAREGGKQTNLWHYDHLIDPRRSTAGSIMPSYEFLSKNDLDESDTKASISAMRRLGVPYPFGYEQQAIGDMHDQAQAIAYDLNKDLKREHISVPPQREIVALIAYLQRLGTDIKGNKTAATAK
jgi:cytochrome c oxidase cbb3-type subunit I/II